MRETLHHAAIPRAPALPIAIAFAVGILIDFHLPTVWPVLGITGLAALISAIVLGGRSRYAGAIGLLIAWAMLGAGRHHLVWRSPRGDDISKFVTEPVLVRLSGRLTTPARIKPWENTPFRSVQEQPDRTVFGFAVEEIITNETSIPTSGRVYASVKERVDNLEIGDRIEVLGRLYLPSGPRNPGGFDYANWLRRQGYTAGLSISEPAAITVMEADSAGLITRTRRGLHRLRVRLREGLRQHLSAENFPIAAALLLGDRTELTEERRDEFVQSGTMHLLAISGLHVGILAFFLLALAKLLGLSPRAATLTVLAIVIGYALLTEGRPSVVRAAILISVLVAGRPWFRDANMANSLSIAALGILLYDPNDLFDVGAQLSFLAVMGLMWSGRFLRREPTAEDKLDALEMRNRFQKVARWTLRKLRESAIVVLCVWSFTAPLVAARFHLVSPVGLALNVLLIPAIAPLLAFGYLMLLTIGIIPAITLPFAVVFDTGLSALTAITSVAGNWRFGHLAVSPPADWWLALFYLLLIVVAFGRFRSAITKWARVACVFTVAGGVVLAGLPVKPTGLRCTFLSIGHGCSILVECPDGRVLLYDCGNLNDGRRAARVVRAALLHRKRLRIDAVFVSHADLDHFNGLPELMKRVPIGAVCVTDQFQKARSDSTEFVLASARSHGVAIQTLRAGDRMKFGDANVSVLHPHADAHFGDDENAASLVVRIEYAGRSILLTGDVENAGLASLRRTASGRTDVCLSPHHGSLKANVPPFIEWAKAKKVIVSSRFVTNETTLRNRYGEETEVRFTAAEGAITVEIAPTGYLEVKPHVGGRR